MASTFRPGVVAFLLLAFVIAGFSTPDTVSTAQTPSADLRRVIDVQVKPESVAAWSAVHRNELLPALKKAGSPWVHVWASAVGDPYLRTIVTPIDNLAEIEFAPHWSACSDWKGHAACSIATASSSMG